MYFVSTRGNQRVTGAQAIVQGIASDGGLFVPETFPKVTEEELNAMLAMNYPERAAFVLHKYLDDYDYDGLKGACERAYAQGPRARSKTWRSPSCPTCCAKGATSAASRSRF